MTRLIIAPVGLQPAAVLAPLLSPPVKPENGDALVLLASGDSAKVAGEIQRAVGALESVVLESQPFVLEPTIRDKILSMAREQAETWILINGGRGEWAEALIAAVAEANVPLTVAGSRDHRGHLFGRDLEVRRFEVADVGLPQLMSFLGLRYRKRRLSRIASDADAMEGVVRLAERAGQLFAAVDASAWTLAMYRRFILDWRRLQRLGLDYRRVLLLGVTGALAARAMQDSIPVVRRPRRLASDADLEAWKARCIEKWEEEVASGEAIRLPERQAKSWEAPGGAPAAISRSESASWTGDPLVVIIGTQPGSTVQTIWGHRPQRLFLLYDPEQPRSSALASRLAAESALGLRDLQPISLADDRLPEDLQERTVDLNITPGDKLDRARLLLWALAAPERRRVWQLQGTRIRRGGSEEREIDRVPLATWMRLYAPGVVHHGTDGARLSAPVAGFARAVAAWFASSEADLDHLAQLWNRARPPRVDTRRKRLIGPGGYDVPFSQLPKDFISAFLPTPDSGSNGRWWEWVVAAMLATHGMHEIRVGVTVRWPEGGQRDELDVATRHGAQFGYWSCKTASVKGVSVNLEEARAQADRLLGRQRLAVLAVPRVITAPAGMEQQGEGHWWRRELGHLVDARLLTDRTRVLTLSQRDDFHTA